MNIVTKAHRNFLLCLLKADVDFILIGGYAVIYHGYPRLTTDMDIWLKQGNENKQKLLSALDSYGIVKKDIDQVESFDFTNTQSFFIGEKSNRIDLLTNIAGLSYEEADVKKVYFNMKDKKVPVIHYEDLIVNKMLTDRPQDKADVDMLQKIQQERSKNK